jgi:hypothetical protein
LYTEFVSQVHHAVGLISSKYQIEIAGMCWMQGESDALVPDKAAAYQTNLTNFIKDLRKEFQVPDMPFIIAMIDSTPSWPYNAVVRKAETTVAASIPHVGIFDTHGFPTHEGHYTTAGLLMMGSSFATTMVSALGTSGISQGPSGHFRQFNTTRGNVRFITMTGFNAPADPSNNPAQFQWYDVQGKIVTHIPASGQYFRVIPDHS